MKAIGMLLLIAGVGIGAATGARLVPEVESRQKAAGTASVMTQQADTAFSAYCEARQEAKLALADGCKAPDTDGDGVADADDKCPDAPETVNGFEDGDGCEDVAPVGTLSVSASVDAIAYACKRCTGSGCNGGCVGSAKKLGATPVSVADMALGDYLVYVTAAGHETSYQEVSVSTGKPATVDAKMTQVGSATLSVSTTPPSPGFVYLTDGKGPKKTLGPLPLVGYAQPAGEYTIHVDTKYYQGFQQTVTLVRDTPAAVNAALAPFDRAAAIKAGKATFAAELAKLGPVPSDLPAEIAEARQAWLSLKEKAVEPVAIAATMGPPKVTTFGRFEDWFSLSGLPFLLSLFLVICGAVISRRAAGQAAQEPEPSDDDKAQHVDFGELLGQVQQEVKALHERMTELDASDEAALAASRDAIQDLQVSKVDLLVEARTGLQARYGVSGFAAIFGPLSAAERHLNRAWCCLVDKHVPAGQSAIVGADAFFEEARLELDKLAKPADTSQPASS